MSFQAFRTAAALACACVAVLAACDRGPTAPRLYTGPVDSLQLAPAGTSVSAGGTLHLAVRTFWQGVLQSGQPPLAWTSSDPTVATVDAGGLIRGLRAGSTTIRAAADSVSATARVAVTAPSGRCGVGGVTHQGTVSGTWRAADGPHRFARSITVSGTLTIEPGTLVCGGPGATLGPLASDSGSTRRTVIALGTAAAPIVFTADDPQRPWGGLRGESTTFQLAHVLIEKADTGMVVIPGTITMDSSVVRQIGGPAILAAIATVTLNAVTIDTAGTGIYINYGQEDLRDVIVRHVTHDAVFCRSSSASINGLHVEDSGNGISLGGDHPCTVTSISGVALLRTASLGDGDLSVLGTILQQPGAADSLRGSPGVWAVGPGHNMSLPGDVTLPPGFTLTVQPSGLDYASPLVMDGHGTLRLSPGSRLTVYPGYYDPLQATLLLAGGVRLVALGTPEAPVTIVAELRSSPDGPPVPAHLGGQPGLPSIFSHANLIGLAVVADSGRPVLLDSSRVSGGQRVDLRAAGSRIVGSTIEGMTDTTALVLANDSVVVTNTRITGSRGTGVRILAPGVLLDSCEVSGSAGDGIVATVAPSAGIHHCNLLSNAGVGLRNLAPDLLDARLNWWGDPAGPTGPAGDGVAGNVDASGWLTGPVGIGAAPPAATGSSARTAPPRPAKRSRVP